MTILSAYGGDSTRQFGSTAFFRVEKADDRCWLVDAEIWRSRYGSHDPWIRQGVTHDPRAWGFNTIGWSQECISGGWGATELNPHRISGIETRAARGEDCVASISAIIDEPWDEPYTDLVSHMRQADQTVYDRLAG